MQAFATAFAKIETTLEYNAEWDNGTGYFDNAVRMVELAAGERARSTDLSGRNIIMVGTPFGTAVAFERFSPRTVDGVEERSGVIVSNVPRIVRTMVQDGRMDENCFFNNFGMDSSNVGTNMKWIVEAGQKLQAA